MKSLFDVSIVELKDVHDWPNSWSESGYRALLHRLELDDIGELTPEELPDMTMMALQELKPESAADHVLVVVFGERLRPGVRQNMTHQLKKKDLYEEYGEIEHHAAIFVAAVLLHQTFPQVFPLPTIARLTLEVTATNKLADDALKREPSSAFFARLVADGVGERSILHRLYGEQIAGPRFPEAGSIIWNSSVSEPRLDSGRLSRQLLIYSSWYWLRPLKSAPKRYQSTAYEDISRP